MDLTLLNGLRVVKVAAPLLEFHKFWFRCALEVSLGLFSCELCLLTPLGPV